MSETTKLKFKVGDRVVYKTGGSYHFQRKDGHSRNTEIGEILTISGASISPSREPRYRFEEDMASDTVSWYNVEKNFNLAMPNWKLLLGGKKK